jgi:DNA (cytosine-5)-methyltransferase 3A
MNVLSLFDGMSCGQQALERIGIKVDNYFASEIDKYAIQVTMANYPNTKQLGSVINVNGYDLPKIDLLIGGSPCQSFSFAGKRKGMSTKDEQEILTLEHYLQLKSEGYEFEGQSYLFWEYMRLLNEVKPKYFLLENVMMGEKWEKVLSKAIGVNPIEINSALVSAQNRRRLYWTNIGMQPMGLFGDLESIIEQPKDKGILLKDILQSQVDDKYFLSEKMVKGFLEHNRRHIEEKNQTGFNWKPTEGNKKAACLRANAALCPTDNSVIVGQLGYKKDFEKSDKAQCLLQRDYKGMSNHGINVVVHNTQKRDENRPSIQKNKNAGGSGHLSRNDGKTYCLDTQNSNAVEIIGGDFNFDGNFRERENGKSETLRARAREDESCSQLASINSRIRRLTPIECERLQTVADNYTNHVSDSQRYKMLGNGWTVEVIAHIFNYLKQ